MIRNVNNPWVHPPNTTPTMEALAHALIWSHTEVDALIQEIEGDIVVESCPDGRNMGMHSDDYYDEGHCIWCGCYEDNAPFSPPTR
jgi:hypothetical protein